MKKLVLVCCFFLFLFYLCSAAIAIGAISKVTIVNLSTEVTAGITVELSAVATDALDNVIAGTVFTWTASYGQVKNSSLTKLEVAGEVTIRAEASGITDEATFKVIPSTLSFILLSPESVTLAQGQSITFKAQGYDIYGNKRSDTDFSYSSILGNSASVIANSEAGDYILTAAKGSHSASAKIIITPKYKKITPTFDNENQLVIIAKDAVGNESKLTTYDELVNDVTGKEYGNLLSSSGKFIEGTQEGAFKITSTAKIGGTILTGESLVNINKGAPRLKIKLADQELKDNLVIPSQPTLNVEATDGNGVKYIRVYIDGVELKEVASQALKAQSSSVIESFAPSSALSVGKHTLSIITEDNLGSQNSISSSGLTVYSALEIQGIPYTYPNPFKPLSQKTTFNYTLTQDSDIKLLIYNLAGRLIASMYYPAGSTGGKTGENEVTWDGKSFAGITQANGVYVYFITSQGKKLGSGEISISQ